MTRATASSLLRVPACTLLFKMLNTRVPPCRADLCAHTTDAAHRGPRRTLTWKRVPSTSKQLANNISLAATPRNPDQDWTFCEHNRNTEATQLIQILSYARTVIKIKLPRETAPAHPQRRWEGRTSERDSQKIQHLLNRGPEHRLLAQSRRLVQQEHAAPPAGEFRSAGEIRD